MKAPAAALLKNLILFFFFLVLGFMDTLAEWSRCRPAKPMGSPRVGSNVDFKSAFVSDGGLNRES